MAWASEEERRRQAEDVAAERAVEIEEGRQAELDDRYGPLYPATHAEFYRITYGPNY